MTELGGPSEFDVVWDILACTPAAANKKKRTVDEELVRREEEGER
ncbi:hypothetical protein CGMCC3_g7040 [Colletotrichum fructicola]|nr:uncharacterized protein CGMCC3_g7040 [Colletotrichum fructicola]KAE9576942.1 hypothetical protein CGMCC3_g7040 [Colletotrichum fructicola]